MRKSIFKTQNCHLKRGYTLIELIVVIVTMALLFTVGFANYRSYQKRQYLENAVRLLKADLRLTQEYALSGKKPQEPPGNSCITTTLNGYFVQLLSSPPRYQIWASCTGGNVSIKGPIDLPSGITLSWSGNPILFQILGKGVATAADITISLSYPSGGVSPRQVTVTKGGEIK